MIDHTSSAPERPKAATSEWKQIVAKYQEPSFKRSVWQIVNTLVPYVGLWCLMYWSLSVSYWLTVPLAILAAGFVVRAFIISHDCGHGSYFKTQRANDIWGFITGVVTFTPYYQWRWEHAIHHASSGDLDRRGTGDVWTLTVQEYLEASRWKRFSYRLARNPFVLFVLAPFYVFLIQQRFPSRTVGKRERRGVYWTNGALLAIAVLMSLTIGIKAYLLIQFPVIMLAAMVGIWLFYVQHQFEEVYWERRADWDFAEAALRGSSFYKLPKILQWFTGNIGFHHVHHLSPRIPNYYLEQCHNETPLLKNVQPLTFAASVKMLGLTLWDEENNCLVGFKDLKNRNLK